MPGATETEIPEVEASEIGATVPCREPAGSDAKRAAQLADRIIDEVIAQGWPVSHVLGAEAELLEHYHVSRAVFREAVRLLEHREVAHTRRGPGGGLVVTEPSVEAVIQAVAVYLHRIDARMDEVFEARIILEEIATEHAVRSLDDDEVVLLRQVAEEPVRRGSDARALHNLIASISGNPATVLFVEVLNRLSRLYLRGQSLPPGLQVDAARAHARIAEAVLAGDTATARRRMRRHLEAEADFLRGRPSTRQLLPEFRLRQPPPGGKLAEILARDLARIVIVGNLQPGSFIGAETELIERFGVSRATFREAVRLLEYHHVARMRRGPGGGLFVVEPSTSAITDIAALYLARRGMRPAQLADMRTALELATVDLAVERMDDAGVERLEAVLAQEETGADGAGAGAARDLHAELARASGNRVLELVALVLIRLCQPYQIDRLPADQRETVPAEILRAHIGIARAVIDGDQSLARHRMQRHMAAITEAVS